MARRSYLLRLVHVDGADLRGCLRVVFLTEGNAARRRAKLLNLAVIPDLDFYRILLLHSSHHVSLIAHSIRHQGLQVVVPPFLIAAYVIRDDSAFAYNLGTVRRLYRVDVGLLHKVGRGEPLDLSIGLCLNHDPISRTLMANVAMGCLHED